MVNTFKEFLLLESTKRSREIIKKWFEQAWEEHTFYPDYFDIYDDPIREGYLAKLYDEINDRNYDNLNKEMIYAYYRLHDVVYKDITDNDLDKIYKIMIANKQSYQDVIKVGLDKYLEANENIKVKEDLINPDNLSCLKLLDKLDDISVYEVADLTPERYNELLFFVKFEYAQNTMSDINSVSDVNELTKEQYDMIDSIDIEDIVDFLDKDINLVDDRFAWYLTSKENSLIENTRRELRKLIDNHVGDKSNPWCLLQKEDGDLSDTSYYYWTMVYIGVQKKIAFKKGKVCAFCGSDDEEDKWWDLQDNGWYQVTEVNGTKYKYEDGKLHKV